MQVDHELPECSFELIWVIEVNSALNFSRTINFYSISYHQINLQFKYTFLFNQLTGISNTVNKMSSK